MRSPFVSWLAFGPAALLAQLHLCSPIPLVSDPRQFHLTLTWEEGSPDGVSRNIIMVNGQSPGPLLEINEGEEVWVTIENQMPFNTTMHYHGIEMEKTPWSDGVPGVTQRNVEPGQSFIHKWTATQYGEYWYHAHYRGQIDDGQYGPIIIHPQSSRPTPFGLISQDPLAHEAMKTAAARIKPLLLADWRHRTSDNIWDIQIAANMEVPCFDSLLFNGKGRVNCWSPHKIASLVSPAQQTLLKVAGAKSMTPKGCLPKEVDAKVLAAGFNPNPAAIPDDIFDICKSTEGSNEVLQVTRSSDDVQGSWVALEIIGAYSLVTTAFSIDGLSMWVYAVDGEYIQPQKVEAITVANGDRYSVLINLATPGNYTMRQAGLLPVQLISGQATLSYIDPDSRTAFKQQNPMPYLNDAGRPITTNVTFFNQTLQKAYPPVPIAQEADQTFILVMGNTDESYKWAVNGTSQPLALEYQYPLLFKPPQPNLLNNLTITTLNNTWIDLIFVATQFPQPSHPIHKHGNKMWLIGSGYGMFKWNTVNEAIKEIPTNFNLVDPPRRDSFGSVDAPSGPTWTAMRYHVTNPGAWLLHCHIQTHLMGGMGMVIQDGVDKWPLVPNEYLDF